MQVHEGRDDGEREMEVEILLEVDVGMQVGTMLDMGMNWG